jgi:phage baseplate assembly protein W
MAITTSNLVEWRDLDFAFKANPNTNDIAFISEVNAVKQSILNILKTNHGEKLFEPLFGANLIAYLFENINQITAIAIKNSIYDAIENYEPRAEIVSLVITPNEGANAISIMLNAKIITTSEEFQLATSIERLR